jgi:hypothetical protein
MAHPNSHGVLTIIAAHVLFNIVVVILIVRLTCRHG